MMGTGGILVANLTAYLLAERWRLVLGASVVTSLLQAAVGPFVMPESRRWLQSRELAAGARQVLVSGGSNGERMAQSAAGCEDGGWGALRTAVRAGDARKPLMIGFGLQVLQQVSGINVAVYYAPTIFKLAHFSDDLSVFLSAAVSLIQIMATLFLAGVIDRVGRRPMCFIGLGFMTLSLVVLGVSFLLSAKAAGGLALGAVLLYRVAFSLSLGPLPYIITAEIFPNRYRASGVSLCWAVNWISNFVVSYTFLPLAEVTTIPGTFFMYAAVCIFAIWFVHHQVPETSGRTLEQLERLVKPEPGGPAYAALAGVGGGRGAARAGV
mmetsp:Transcript_71592/g.209841  ORF Transcript_71592/g.209841 Transcript_71592/m.209841 type:complete len:324 (-) Transcript_71592:29-1000(-)